MFDKYILSFTNKKRINEKMKIVGKYLFTNKKELNKKFENS